MNRITRVLLAGALALASIGIVSAIPAGAAPTNCTGNATTPRVGPIVVPDGAYCILTGSDRPTTVTVNPAGKLFMYQATADSVLAYGTTSIWDSTVRNSTVLTGITNGASSVCGSTLGGAGLLITRNVSSVQVAPSGSCQTSTSVAGNLKVTENAGSVFIHGVSIVDFLLCARNAARPIVGAVTTLDGVRWGQCA